MRLIELLPGRLYYTASEKAPSAPDMYTFNIDADFVYEHFFADFGPLHLGRLYRFSEKVNGLLKDSALRTKRIVFHSSPHEHKKANAVYLASCYLVSCHGFTAEDAAKPFLALTPPPVPFRDASFGICTYTITFLDCCRAIAKAMACGYYSFEKFDIEAYEKHTKLENGDINWIVPGKFLAFSGPHDVARSIDGQRKTYIPSDYVPPFKSLNVECVIRLNRPHYNPKPFIQAGIKHVEMYYPDGGIPPAHILEEFLRLADETKGALAVHCKAGLGRTGTCIGAWMMKTHKWTAREVIAWQRICRPGSVLGPQQYYMESIQQSMWDLGEAQRAGKSPTGPLSPFGEDTSGMGLGKGVLKKMTDLNLGGSRTHGGDAAAATQGSASSGGGGGRSRAKTPLSSRRLASRSGSRHGQRRGRAPATSGGATTAARGYRSMSPGQRRARHALRR